MSARPSAAEVHGTLRAITLRNVNKARGRFTFNVELTLERRDGRPLIVRVDEVYWERLTDAERAELSPAPAPTIALQSYADWTVGETVSLEVALTSPGLAHLVRRRPSTSS